MQHSPPVSFLCAVMQVLWAVEEDLQHVLPSGHRSRLGLSPASPRSPPVSPPEVVVDAVDAGHSTQARHVVQPLHKKIKSTTEELQKGRVMMNGRSNSQFDGRLTRTFCKGRWRR
jgi:hypothetical protein